MGKSKVEHNYKFLHNPWQRLDLRIVLAGSAQLFPRSWGRHGQPRDENGGKPSNRCLIRYAAFKFFLSLLEIKKP